MLPVVGIQLMYRNQAIICYWPTTQLGRPERIARTAAALMQYLVDGKLEISVGQTLPLAEAAAAHRAIAERTTTSKVVLLTG